VKTCATVFLVLCICPGAATATSPTADQLLAQSQTLAVNKQFDEALQSLKQAAALEPENMDVKLAVANVHSWQGRYDEAQKELNALLAANPDNTDIQSAAAYLDYYQGHNDAAQAKFVRMLATHPDNADATEGLRLAQQAQKAAAGFSWQFDTGYEHSSFARRPQPDWSNEFVQITRHFDQGTTSVHGRFEHYDEFQTTDTYYEFGADHRFAPYLDGYIYGGHTVDASFRPDWREGGGGDLRLNTPEQSVPAAWLTLDLKQDDYAHVSVATIDPGARIEFAEWALNPNLVMVHQWGLPSIFGWNARLDGPLLNDLRFYTGYSNAPETENAVTVYTASFYGGFSYGIDDAHAVSLGYTHDDRQNAYIRHVVDVSLTCRF